MRKNDDEKQSEFHLNILVFFFLY